MGAKDEMRFLDLQVLYIIPDVPISAIGVNVLISSIRVNVPISLIRVNKCSDSVDLDSMIRRFGKRNIFPTSSIGGADLLKSSQTDSRDQCGDRDPS